MSLISNKLYSVRRQLQVLLLKITTPEFMSKVYFYYVLRYKLNLKKPQSLNEKIQWLKLYYWPLNELAIQCADKYAVREYVKSKNLGHILNELLFVWDDPQQIDWEALPDEFVIKCNHGCGYNVICRDKSQMNKKKTIRQITKWFNEDFSLFNVEPHYSKIHKKIICEKLLKGEIINYNFYVLNGKVIFFSVAGGLGGDSEEHLTYYNADSTKARFENASFKAHENKLTELLPQMITVAECFGEDFPLVRVDLFDIDDRIILSELTFTPGGGLIPFEPISADFELGKKLDISTLVG